MSKKRTSNLKNENFYENFKRSFKNNYVLDQEGNL